MAGAAGKLAKLEQKLQAAYKRGGEKNDYVGGYGGGHLHAESFEAVEQHEKDRQKLAAEVKKARAAAKKEKKNIKQQAAAINGPKQAFPEVTRALMTQLRAFPAQPQRQPGWAREICTWERYERAVARAGADVGVGKDGYSGYLTRKASPEVRRPDATQSPEALVGPPSSVGGLLEGLMNAPGGAAELAHAFQARQNAQRAARDDIYDSDDDVARRLQDDYDEEEEDDDEGLARRLQDGDEEGDARLARRLAGQRGASVNDGDAVLAAFLGGGGPPPLERRLSTGEDDPALQRALLQSTRPQQSAFAAGVDAQLERALAASRAEAGLEATARWDAPGPASPSGADDDDAALQAALLESAPPQQSEEERQIAKAIRLSALEAAPEEVLMTDAAATGARRLNRRRGSSDPDERMTSGAGSRKTD